MKNNKGITLVELIVAIAIMSMIFLVTGSFMMFGTKTHKLTSGEAITQSTTRLLAQNINNSVRNSSATFTLHKSTNSNFSEKWNYIMVSEDKKSVLKYEWDESQGRHIKSTLMDEVDGTTFEIEYEKASSYTTDNIVGFKIIPIVNGKKSHSSKRTVESGLEGLNSLQIIDRRSAKGPSNTIAYRNDPLPTLAESQAAISMVLDVSGSMEGDMNGNYTNVKVADRRITKLKAEATRLVESLADNPDIYLSLNPFSGTANGSKEMVQVKGSNLIDQINNLKTSSGTNTSDGMRRGFYRIKEFNEKDSTKKRTKNFMIILVDGRTSRVSLHTYNKDKVGGEREFVTGDSDIENKVLSQADLRYPYRSEKGVIYSSSGGSATKYLNTIGPMIKNYRSHKFHESIKTYVIGFSNRSEDIDRIEEIAKATSGSTKVYKAGDEAALRDIFDMIKKDIDDALWLIGGPK